MQALSNLETVSILKRNHLAAYFGDRGRPLSESWPKRVCRPGIRAKITVPPRKNQSCIHTRMYMRILAYEGVPCGLLGRARGLTSQVLWSERARRGPVGSQVGSQVGPARAKPGRPRATPGRPGHGPGHPRHRATQHVKLETRNRMQTEFKTKQIPDLAKQVHKTGRRAKIPKSSPLESCPGRFVFKFPSFVFYPFPSVSDWPNIKDL